MKYNNNCNDCQEQNPCQQVNCGCPIPDLSAACVIYKGDKLTCIGAEVPENLEILLKKFDEAICDKLDVVLGKGNLVNIGEGTELYAGINNLGQREIRTLISSDGSIIIELNEEENSIDFIYNGETFILEKESTTADAQIISDFDSANNKYTFKGLKSDSITIDTDAAGNITLEIDVPTAVDLGITSSDSTITVTEPTANNFDLSFEQAQADVLVTDTNSPAFIKNKNAVKTVSTDYTIVTADSDYVIVVDATSADVVITISPSTLPNNNFFVGFLQKGLNEVSFVGQNILPVQYNPKMQGQGHNAAVEMIGGQAWLFGSLEETA